MSLEDWSRNGWLVEHQPSSQEIHDLFTIVERDMRDCGTPGLSPDWRLNIAYNAALQAATAALTASGYRASRESHHYRVIQSLALTINAETRLVRRLDQFRKKRNTGGYDRAGTITDREADEMVAVAQDLQDKVLIWLRLNHPDLLAE